MEYCAFLCNQYSYTSINPFFDGNINLFSEVNLKLFSIFRKVWESKPLSLSDNKEEIAKIDTLDFTNEFYNAPRKMQDLHELDQLLNTSDSKSSVKGSK